MYELRQPLKPTIGHASAKDLMAHGPEALHAHVSNQLETALGRAMHQMEVRFHDISVSADVVMASSKSTTNELPTIANSVRKSVGGIFAKKHKITKHILKNVSGVFKPGTMTLVLGQPGSGKSSLMKILSGRFPMSGHVQLSGDVTYNGATTDEMRKRLPQFVSYVTQRDTHFPTLTVKETLELAHEFNGGVHFSKRLASTLSKTAPEETKAAVEAVQQLSEHYTDVVIQQLGLENCQDTVVGDAMLRGVSGGERKRVTTGEMQFGSSLVTFMDEISTGLDSAATFDIIKTQRSVAKNLRKTVVIALLQPSPEVFALFDDVLILNDGEVMYHGPRDQVESYFADLGFVCPPERDVADFLLDLGTRQQRRYEVTRRDASQLPRKASGYASIFRQSRIYNDMIQYVNGPHDPALLEDKKELFELVPEFHQSFWASTRTLMGRERKKMSRNPAFYIGHLVLLALIGFLNASVFWQFDPKNPQVVLGIVFGTVQFVGFSQTAHIPVYMAERDIFYRQRGANFYRTSAYVMSQLACQLPISIAEAIIVGTISYWLCGFVAEAGAYFIFLLVLALTSLIFTAMFFFLAAISPDLHVAEPISSVSLLVFGLYSGFIMAKGQIPDYFVWVYWLNPVGWGVHALAVNQYRNDHFDVCVYENIDYCKQYGMQMGEYTLRLFSVEPDRAWLWYGIIFLAGGTIVFMALAALVLEYNRYESPHNTMLNGDDDNSSKKTDEWDTESGSGSGQEASSEYGLITTPRKDGHAVVDIHRSSHHSRVTPITIAFRDLHYSVPNPTNPKEDLELLKGINGFALPGKMTALMGSSGAGKTTLMDVIAGRKTGGKIRGQILFNGHPATDLVTRRSTGYCEQMDIHSDASTFREALTFSAFLRQDSTVPDSAKYDSVEECLDLLDLRPIADQIIRGSSVEQMKRLTIGVELAAQPSVLFLDEPTSGLDARSAKLVMEGVRKVADTGRTIVCTIHQPSTEVFMLFDSLLLLKRGGQTVYFGDLGDRAGELISYFEKVPGVSPIEEGYNPGTWMLEVIGAGVGSTANEDVDFVEVFNASEKALELEENLSREGVGRPSPLVGAVKFEFKRAASEWKQAKFVTKRFLDLYWRTPTYNLSRFMVSIFVGLVFGLAYLRDTYDTYQGINAGEGMVCMTAVFLGSITYVSVIPFAAQERASYYRERASQTYNALWYFVGSTVAEIPFVFASCLAFMVLYFPMVGFSGAGNFFFYWFIISSLMLFLGYAGQFLAYALPTIELATIVSVLILNFFFNFMGFNPPPTAIPIGWRWMYEITPPRFAFNVLSAIVFGDCPVDNPDAIGCARLNDLPPTLPPNLTVKEYVETVFEVKHSDIGLNILYLFISIVFFRVLALLSLRFLNHQKK
ncbi:hypothetical protein Poli38472_007588 [Pythium oligandrum]|uniref:ABC transporter domain-containing protein n=1 Tax=Pythium oligandrum TaxID=41045 RepID=A0A8K1CSM7_PYTOL|nr:hypothetical protein Poli38472_007588 [Pythium oligandrum]|eukprot:TMW67916.1 hypothetical protein Poli38472_007588 [Pythium oligandrum]